MGTNETLASADLARQPPNSLSDYAIRAIREDLIEGRLLPGQRITTEELAHSLQISHVPVREALRYLEAEGHLERGPRSRIIVAPVSTAEAEEIYRLRELLETEIHRTAVPDLTEADFASLEALFNELETAVATRDAALWSRANRAFHFVAFDRSGMKWMVRFLGIVWDAAARYQASLIRRSGWEEDLQRHHAQLIDAMRRRDVDAVNAVMNDHRRVTIEAMRSGALLGAPPVTTRPGGTGARSGR